MSELDNTVQEFLFHCQFEKNLSFHTRKAYSLDLKQFLNFLTTGENVKKLNKIDKQVLRNYLKTLLGKNKVKTVKRKIATLKALFNYLEYEDKVKLNPFRKLRIKIKEPLNLPSIMSLQEIKTLFATLYNAKNTHRDGYTYSYKSIVRDIVVLELLFATGMRVFELCNLTISDMDLQNNVIHVRGKGNKERIIQICNPEITNILREYILLFHSGSEESDYFFLNRLGQRLSEQSVRFMIKKYAKQSEIHKNITPHMFRHTFATLLLEEGVDIRYIQQFLGHSSITTTQIYTHVTQSKQQEILATKHPRGTLTFSPTPK